MTAISPAQLSKSLFEMAKDIIKDLITKKLPFGLIMILPLLLIFGKSFSQKKPFVAIGINEWTTENLNVTRFRNGDPIPEAKSDEDWARAATEGTPAWCYYNNDPATAKKYGVLYNWHAVNDKRGLSPAGWDIPAREQLLDLMNELGENGGSKLKSKAGWTGTQNVSATSGFEALPSGIRSFSGSFDDLGKYAYYWTITPRLNEIALSYSIGYKHAAIDTTGRFSFLRKGSGMSVRCVRRISYDGFKILPENVPNEGIMFIDHESTNRSGHYGSALTTCKNGDVIAFYTNVSGKILEGHGIAGWSEYKRSSDGGKTWGKPVVLEYSKKTWDLNNVNGDKLGKDQLYVASFVRSVITAPNGTLVAFLSRQMASATDNYDGFNTPVYILSYDNGHTWTEPREVDPIASARQLSLTNDDGASFVHDGVIYTVFIGGFGTGEYSFYASKDNGETFSKVSEGLFKNRKYKRSFFYMTAKALDDGRFIVYSYDFDDEHNFPYVISNDKGKTWSEIKTTYMAKRIRDAQMSEKVGSYYFMVGRSGSFGNDPMNMVLYASENGIDWDAGRYLKKIQKTQDSYSAIEVVRGINNTPPKVLIQGTVGYGVGASVNIKHWWIEDIK